VPKAEDWTNFGSCVTAHGDVSHAEGTESLQFQRVALCSARKSPEQCQGPLEVFDGLWLDFDRE
jgi:hypothetical protein